MTTTHAEREARIVEALAESLSDPQRDALHYFATPVLERGDLPVPRRITRERLWHHGLTTEADPVALVQLTERGRAVLTNIDSIDVIVPLDPDDSCPRCRPGEDCAAGSRGVRAHDDKRILV